MSAHPFSSVCQFVDAGDHLECVGGTAANLSVLPQPITVGPTLIPAGDANGVGGTYFNVTYDNFAEPALSSTRYNELRPIINSYLGEFSACLGPNRDTSNVNNKIVINTKIDFASISESYIINLSFGSNPDNPIAPSARWRYTITKYNSAGVFVKDIPTNLTDNQVFPSTWSASIVTTLSPDRQLLFGSQFDQVNGSFNFPTGNFVCAPYAEFRWTYTQPAGSAAVPPLNFPVGVPTESRMPMSVDFASPPSYPALEAVAFYVNPTPAWVSGSAPAGTIGTSILAQAGPQYLSFFNQGDNIQQTQPDLFNCTGPALPAPITPLPAVGPRNNGTTPLFWSSQWRFMRIYPEWAPYQAFFDAALPNTLTDVGVTVNTDFNRLAAAPSFYDFANSYLVSDQSDYCFKAVLIHELFHGLGFIEGFVWPVDASTYAASLYNHYFFSTANKPANVGEFATKLRTISSVATGNWVSNGAGVDAPIQPTSQSHLLLSAPPDSQNGIMEPSISPGNIIPTGTAPNGGPSKNDLDVLLVGCVADCTMGICVAENTVIMTHSGEKTISELHSGELVMDCHGRWVPVVKNVRIPAWESFVVIPRNALREGVPSKELRIRPGHALLIDGREVLCEELIGQGGPGCGKVELVTNGKSRVYVYTLVTNQRTFVQMQGMNVGTWGADAWENYRQNDFSAKMFALEQ